MVSFTLTLMVMAYLLTINFATYAAFAIDKGAAIENGRLVARNRGRPVPRRVLVRRVSEASLLMLTLIGGGAGAIVAQQRLRHKTRKEPFRNMLWLIAMVEVGLASGFAIAVAVPG